MLEDAPPPQAAPTSPPEPPAASTSLPPPPPAPVPVAQDPEEGRVSRVGRWLVLLVLVSIVLGTLVLTRSGRTVTAGRKGADDESSSPFSLLGNEDGIAIVKIYGVISFDDESSYSSFASGADRIVRTLKKLRKMDHVKGVVLRINSPGGTVGASQEIHNQVKALVAEGKKVVVSMGDVAASGGYYVAAPASFIYANPGTITGSIGVITSAMNYQDLIQKIGLKFEVFKSGQFKDMGAGYRELTPQERDLFQQLIKGAWQQFVDAVAGGRIIAEEEKDGRKKVLTSKEKLETEIAQGQIFLGSEAHRLGLVDELGDFHQAIEKAGELCGLGKDPHLVKAGTGAGLERLMELLETSSEAPRDPLKALLAGGPWPPLLYLYVPGGKP